MKIVQPKLLTESFRQAQCKPSRESDSSASELEENLQHLPRNAQHGCEAKYAYAHL